MKGRKSGGARKYGRNKIKCQRYFNERRRIKNKTKKLEEKIRHLELERAKGEVINKNTNLPTKRRPIENIIKSCKIERKREKRHD